MPLEKDFLTKGTSKALEGLNIQVLPRLTYKSCFVLVGSFWLGLCVFCVFFGFLSFVFFGVGWFGLLSLFDG